MRSYGVKCNCNKLQQPLDFLPETCHTERMNKTQTIPTIFGSFLITYVLVFADCGVICEDEEFGTLESARDVAWEISAETNRRVNVIQCHGQSEHLVESVLA